MTDMQTSAVSELADTVFSPTKMLSEMGVSIWLDDLSRDILNNGELKQLIHHRNVVGVTTNPTIFEASIRKSSAYMDQLAELSRRRFEVAEALTEITVTDVATASTLFSPVFERTHGVDGRVSIEVSPHLAHDSDSTLAEARHLWAKVNRPNVMIKIPATEAGLPAITAAIADGICVNVTLLFSVERYREVIHAYLKGLELAERRGHDLSKIHSVASFFVSRVDTEVDRRLEEIGTAEAHALKTTAGIANARLAYAVFLEEFSRPRARRLLACGARPQRPLWASTGVKNPSLPDTAYVTELIAPGVVNTMPPATLEAVADHGAISSDTVTGNIDDARQTLELLADVGISYADVTAALEREGIEKFRASWNALEGAVATALQQS